MARRRRGPRIELRLQLLALLILLGIGGIVARLWWVQVARGAKYTARLAGRSQVTVRIPSVRGEIRDRNGITLVQNRASYEVDFYLPDMVRGYRAINGWAPTTQYMAPVHGMMKVMTEEDIVQIVNDAVIPRLEDLDIARDYNAKRLQLHYRNDTEVPYTYIEDLDFPTIAKFSEHDVGLPGVDIAIKPVRQYLYGALAAHLLGYVGMPRDIDQQPDIHAFNFYQPDTEGKSNIELAMDKYLRGTPGVRVMQRNVKGVIDSELRVEQPKPGANVNLTIDARIQMIAERALRVIGRGAAVVVDPNNGDILAMASVPSYDPNKFIPSISLKDWQQLDGDDTDPLTNRAISAYAPGSTFKTVTALAGLRKGLANAHFTCTGGVIYGNKYMKCWIGEKGGAHGTLGLSDAIKVSCNAFFYQFGNAAGIDNIDAVGTALGIGQKTGIPLTGESPGILPGPEWMAANNPNERWVQRTDSERLDRAGIRRGDAVADGDGRRDDRERGHQLPAALDFASARPAGQAGARRRGKADCAARRAGAHKSARDQDKRGAGGTGAPRDVESRQRAGRHGWASETQGCGGRGQNGNGAILAREQEGQPYMVPLLCAV